MIDLILMDYGMQEPQPNLVEQGNTIKLSLPSVLGYEKLVWQMIAWVAPRLELAARQVADLQTATCEACINAIEHGNQGRPQLQVEVILVNSQQYVEAFVCDEGVLPFQHGGAPAASIEEKLAGLAPARGMGLLLIHQLVDEAEFVEGECAKGNCFRLRIYRPTNNHTNSPRSGS